MAKEPEMQRFEIKSFDEIRREEGTVYIVTQYLSGWKCSCPNWKFVRQKNGENCKHIVHCMKFPQSSELARKVTRRIKPPQRTSRVCSNSDDAEDLSICVDGYIIKRLFWSFFLMNFNQRYIPIFY